MTQLRLAGIAVASAPSTAAPGTLGPPDQPGRQAKPPTDANLLSTRTPLRQAIGGRRAPLPAVTWRATLALMRDRYRNWVPVPRYLDASARSRNRPRRTNAELTTRKLAAETKPWLNGDCGAASAAHLTT